MNNPWNNRRPSARPPRATPLPRPEVPATGGGGRGGSDELRLYGLNAVLAAFEARPQALRKLYLLEARIPRLQPLLKWCVANRVGYRVVEDGDLNKLAGTTHHEGVVADVLRAPALPLSQWLEQVGDGPALALWLDGVGNPHNLGAILRSAAHFGAKALLL
ncbi:TPA: RNA methyltransferase substrate-binding domain-containing protein, partial [Stenotrophomonas maltophilia]